MNSSTLLYYHNVVGHVNTGCREARHAHAGSLPPPILYGFFEAGHHVFEKDHLVDLEKASGV